MKKAILCLLVAIYVNFNTTLFAQSKIENIILITTDGLRWQEVFNGMDTAIAHNPKFIQYDSAYLYKNYWKAQIADAFFMEYHWNPGAGLW